jgi:hypothetical protein
MFYKFAFLTPPQAEKAAIMTVTNTRTIDVRMTFDNNGQRYSVEPLEPGGQVIEPESDLAKQYAEIIPAFGTMRPEDLRKFEVEGVNVETSVVLITDRNPTCLIWRVRRTSNGYDFVCVKWA